MMLTVLVVAILLVRCSSAEDGYNLSIEGNKKSIPADDTEMVIERHFIYDPVLSTSTLRYYTKTQKIRPTDNVQLAEDFVSMVTLRATRKPVTVSTTKTSVYNVTVTTTISYYKTIHSKLPSTTVDLHAHEKDSEVHNENMQGNDLVVQLKEYLEELRAGLQKKDKKEEDMTSNAFCIKASHVLLYTLSSFILFICTSM